MQQTISISRNHFLFLSLLWLAVHILLFVYPGIRLELFDSKVYTMAGDHLVQFGRLEKVHHYFYFLPIALIGILNTIDSGLTILVVFQSLVSAFASLAIYKAAASLFNDSRASLFAVILFLLWWDMIQWNTALLTESLFCSLTCFLVFHLVNFQDSKKDYGILLGLLASCVLTRPTGLIVIAATAVFILLRFKDFLTGKPALKVAVCLLILILCSLMAITMFSIWDFSDQYVRGNIVTYIDTAEENNFGLQIDTSDLVLPNPNDSPLEKIIGFVYHNPIHFIHAGVLKIFYLISGIRPYYSLSHNVLNVGWNSMIYFLFIIGYIQCANNGMRAFALTVISINCLLVGISTIDWDNRFYVPMVPVLALFSAGGGLHLVKTLLRPRISQ